MSGPGDDLFFMSAAGGKYPGTKTQYGKQQRSGAPLWERGRPGLCADERIQKQKYSIYG